MNKLFLTAISISVFAGSAFGQFIAGWDFQTTTSGGTAVLGAPNTPTSYVANVVGLATGTLYLDGVATSSSWLQASELSAFGGSAVNASNGLTSVTTSPAALALLGGTGNSANGKSIVFLFDLTSVLDPIEITLSAQRTSTGFTTQTWDYSTDGITYNPIGTFIAGSTAGTLTLSFAGSGVLTLPQFSGLAGASTAYVRATFDGATTASGNNRIDNIQVNAVPEPSTYALLALGGLGLAGHLIRRRRR